MKINAQQANANFLIKNKYWDLIDTKEKVKQFIKVLNEIEEYSFKMGYIFTQEPLFEENKIKLFNLGFLIKQDQHNQDFIVWNEQQFDMHIQNNKIIIG